MQQDDHAEGKAAASAAVLEHWKRLSTAAREAGMTELADEAERQAALRDTGKTPTAAK